MLPSTYLSECQRRCIGGRVVQPYVQLCGHIGGRVDAAVRCKRRRAAVGAAATSKQREEASKRACGVGAADVNAGAGVSI